MGKIIETRQVEFVGALSEALGAFLQEKRTLGCKYNTQAVTLVRLDKFSADFDIAKNSLSRELVEAWCAKKPNENARNQKDRIWLTNQLVRFMQRQGWETYAPSLLSSINYSNDFVPHIFTEAELRLIFSCANEQPYCGWSKNKDKIVPLIFRMMYGCGLRVSEAVKLKIRDVDTKSAVLTILDSKNGKDRLVPMSSSLAKRCEQYMEAVHTASAEDTFFFPAPYTGSYRADSIYKMFRSILWRAGISHGGRGNGPRLHDLSNTHINKIRTFHGVA